MGKYIYLLLAEDGNGCPHLFAADRDACFSCGDLAEWDGELFEVKDVCFIDTETNEYRIFNSLCEIKEPDRIFSEIWKKNKEETK